MWRGRAAWLSTLVLTAALLAGVIAAPATSAAMRWEPEAVGETALPGVGNSAIFVEQDGSRTVAWISGGAIVARTSSGDEWSAEQFVAETGTQSRLYGSVNSTGIVTLVWADDAVRGIAVRSARLDRRWSAPVTLIDDARADNAASVGVSLAEGRGGTFVAVSTGSASDPSRPRHVEVFAGTDGNRRWDVLPPIVPTGDLVSSAALFPSGSSIGLTWHSSASAAIAASFLEEGQVWTPGVVVSSGGAQPVAVGATSEGEGPTAAIAWATFDPATVTRTWHFAWVDGSTVASAQQLVANMPNASVPALAWDDGSVWITGIDGPEPTARVKVWLRGARSADLELPTAGVPLSPRTDIAVSGLGAATVSWRTADVTTGVQLHVARWAGGEWSDAATFTDAREGFAVASSRPTVLWQRNPSSSQRAEVVVSTYREVIPTAPTLTRVRVKSDRSVTARWLAPEVDFGVKEYVVQVRVGKRSWITRTRTSVEVQSFSFRGQKGRTYAVRVAAQTDLQRGPWSNTKTVKVR